MASPRNFFFSWRFNTTVPVSVCPLWNVPLGLLSNRISQFVTILKLFDGVKLKNNFEHITVEHNSFYAVLSEEVFRFFVNCGNPNVRL